MWSQHGITIPTKCKVYKAIVLPTLLYSAETYILFRRHIRKLSQVHLCPASTANPSDLMVRSHFKCRSVETGQHVRYNSHTACIPTPLDWSYPNEQRLIPKGCVLWGIIQRETPSWWRAFAIHRCDKKASQSHTHPCKHLGIHCTGPATVVIHQGKIHIVERLAEKYQYEHDRRNGILGASIPTVFCDDCGRGFLA